MYPHLSPISLLLPLLPLLVQADKLIEIGQAAVPGHYEVGPQEGITIYGVPGNRAGLNFEAQPDGQFRLISTSHTGAGGDVGPWGAGIGEFQYAVDGVPIGCHFWTTPGFNTDSSEKLRWVFQPGYASDPAHFFPIRGGQRVSCDAGNWSGIYLTCGAGLSCSN